MDQCHRKSNKGRVCLFDASPEHEIHMNIGVVSELDERIKNCD